jgi:rod shape determining protein RodA
MVGLQEKNITATIDWTVVIVYLVLVLMGWLNIYAAVYNEEHSSIFDFGMKYGNQMILICAAFVIAGSILLIDLKFFTFFSFIIYGFSILLLILVLVVGKEVNGNKAWLMIGKFTLQPAEFAKVGASFALAKYMSSYNIKVTDLKPLSAIFLILGAPMLLILLQPDVGSLLVFLAFSIVLFREGLPGGYLLFGFVIGVLFFMALLVSKIVLISSIIGIGYLVFVLYTKKYKETAIGLGVFALLSLILWGIGVLMGKAVAIYYIIAVAFFVAGLGFLVVSFFRRIRYMAAFVLFMMGSIFFVFSVDYVFNNVLQDHQRSRMNILLGIESDPLGMGYNVNQSLIAIGSGGFLGKGYLQGTQTKYNFVPEQSTDFIFCTVGEEWGFVGTFVVLGLFLFLLVKLVNIAERQRSVFSRVFAYSVASIIFFHIFVNVGMAIGLLPVIGIPLPFFSYGGSSLWAFTILLFTVVRLDASRLELLK